MPGVRQDAPNPRWDDQYSQFPVQQPNMYHRSSVHSNGYSTDGQQSVVGEDTPTYVMEHLATFTVAKETGIVYPADGMRRLLQLEKSNGIWSQKMQMRLDRNWVEIMDFETGAVMERFPVALIQVPTAFSSNDPMEIYNNILVFIVGEERSSSRSEMHIFQCQRISAQELVEDLEMLRAGKVPPGRQSRHIPPPPATPPPEPPNNGINVREQVSVFNAASHQSDPRGGHGELGPGIYPPRDGLNDETSSTSSEKYERDVTILNHCFDDIEKFIARLQHAAAASRELERRRRSRKSKKKDMGDGMLTMRSKPPPEGEFVDIFQKFKLSFNLLAKLKAHIHDPNAPELVHFLFTPLALIVDASHDTHYGPNLPSKVISPLLTREAVNLLINCVTSKETELWHSLGDAWLIPRDQWKGYVPPYHPVFLDGWSPEYPVTDERDGSGGPMVAAPPEDKRTAHEPDLPDQHYHPERDDSHYSSDYYDEQHDAPDGRYYGGRPDRYRDERERSQSPGGSDHDFPPGPAMSSVPVTSRDISARSDISVDSIERNGGENQRFERAQARWLEDLRARGAKIVQVTYPRTANNDKELSVIRGEYLEVVDDSRKWWKARNHKNQVAHVPHTIVAPYPPGGDSGDHMGYGRGYDRYSGQESPRDGAGGDGRPTRSPPIPPPQPAEWVRKERLGKKDDFSSDEDGLPIARSNTNSIPPPPPPPAPGTISAPSSPKLVRSKSSTSLSRQPSLTDLHQEELRNVLTMFRNKSRKDLEIHKTPEVYIDDKSSPDEVRQWLKAKGFSDETSKRMNGMNGTDLFSLNKDQLVTHCGKSEGNRLNSQLTVQRNMSGYKTTRSSELRDILAKVRSRMETPDSPPFRTIPKDSTSKFSSSSDDENSFSSGSQKDSEPVADFRNSSFGDLLKEQRKKMQMES